MSLLLKIYKNSYLCDYIHDSGIDKVFYEMHFYVHICDDNYTDSECKLIIEIISDFKKIYFNFAEVLLKEKGTCPGCGRLYLHEIPYLFASCKENQLEFIYGHLLFNEYLNPLQILEEYIKSYPLVKRKSIDISATGLVQ
jgi:hypothetical protein